MKKYQDEQSFVSNFAKEAKESLRNGQNFEAEVNNISVVVTNMDNNNASKVTVYTATVDGVEFSGSITALKKRLNVTYVKEYSRSAEGTKVSIKSDEELQATAKTAAERYIKAAVLIAEYNKRYAITADNLDNIQSVIFEALKQARDKAAAEREAEAKRKAEEVAKKLADEKAKLEKQLAELQAKLAKIQ